MTRNTVVEFDASGAQPCVQILGNVNHVTLMLLAGTVAMLVLLNYQCVCLSVRPHLYRSSSVSNGSFKIAQYIRWLLRGPHDGISR
jgi:hypothetical protein